MFAVTKEHKKNLILNVTSVLFIVTLLIQSEFRVWIMHFFLVKICSRFLHHSSKTYCASIYFAVACLIKISTLEIQTPCHLFTFSFFGLLTFWLSVWPPNIYHPAFISRWTYQCSALMHHIKLTSRANGLKAAFLCRVLCFGSPEPLLL